MIEHAYGETKGNTDKERVIDDWEKAGSQQL